MSRLAREDAGLARADLFLMERLDELRPDDIAPEERLDGKWELSPASDLEDDGWMQAELLCISSAVPTPHGWTVAPSASVLAAAKSVADGLERELRWYFQERDTRFLTRRRDPVGSPCARTVFARRLQRFAATALRGADRGQLGAWCLYLRRIVDAKVFSASNWLWPSRFEQSLEACLVRLEGLRNLMEREAKSTLVCQHRHMLGDEECALEETCNPLLVCNLQKNLRRSLQLSLQQALPRGTFACVSLGMTLAGTSPSSVPWCLDLQEKSDDELPTSSQRRLQLRTASEYLCDHIKHHRGALRSSSESAPREVIHLKLKDEPSNEEVQERGILSALRRHLHVLTMQPADLPYGHEEDFVQINPAMSDTRWWMAW